ncbi:hypothetical protein GALMADRAFT_153538 [Galerina marginata CBS 339.88]|uniref:Uncharacterized protein n=1 Tax=Galerina marginata (strain CBS 339.88) TaxID=685588 RepID=A0A067T958_GALM3|nr:hypothetical protein GALMADRAFT_153538 [Galerina marginata CBS 339.88]
MPAVDHTGCSFHVLRFDDPHPAQHAHCSLIPQAAAQPPLTAPRPLQLDPLLSPQQRRRQLARPFQPREPRILALLLRGDYSPDPAPPHGQVTGATAGQQQHRATTVNYIPSDGALPAQLRDGHTKKPAGPGAGMVPKLTAARMHPVAARRGLAGLN